MTTRQLREPARLAGAALLRCQSDERLVDLARDGQERAFEAIVERYRSPLDRYCRRILPAARVEDAVQQTFINAHRAMNKIDGELELRPWLYRIAHNTSLNLLRERVWAPEDIDVNHGSVSGADEAFAARQDLAEVLSAVQELPERQREAIVLRELEGRSYEDIATALEVTPGAVRQLLHRSRARVRTAVTAVTPIEVLHRLLPSGSPAESLTAARLGELVAATGAGGAAAASKIGVTAVVVGALAGGAIEASTAPEPPEGRAASSEQAARAGDLGVPFDTFETARANDGVASARSPESRGQSESHRRGRRKDGRGSSGPGSGSSGDDERDSSEGHDGDSSGSSGPGSSSDAVLEDSSGPSDSSGSGSSGASGDDSSGSSASGGSSGSGSSESGSSGSGSGSSISGSGSSGSGSGSSGSGSGGSGSGSSGSSGSGSSLSG